MKLWEKLLALAALIACLACPSRAITPQVTITATSATLLGTTQTISLDCHLIDPNGTGVLRVGTSVITNMDTSTVTPGTTATCGPLWGADVITDGFGNVNTTYYLVSVYVVTNGILASTASLSQAYQLDGSATYDLSTALPYSLGAVSPAGSVLGQNLTFTGTNNHTGAETFSNIITNLSNGTFTETTPTAGKYFRDNGTSFVPSSLLAADIPASTSQCTGVQFAIGINSGDVTHCATPPTFGASGASHAVGYVPDPGSSAGSTRFLREDATWDVPTGFTVTQVDLTAQGANIGATTIVTPSANGYYRITGYEVLTRAGTVSSTMPSVGVSFTDADSGVAQGPYFFLAVSSGNTLGGLAPCNSVGGACEIIFYAKSGVAIQYQTASYATSGATSMQYALHLRLEGPF